MLLFLKLIKYSIGIILLYINTAYWLNAATGWGDHGKKIKLIKFSIALTLLQLLILYLLFWRKMNLF